MKQLQPMRSAATNSVRTIDVYKRQVMHMIATGSFAIVAGNIYRHNKTRKGAALSLCIGTLTMTIVMVFLNLLLTPIFMNTPREAVIEMIVPIIIPFNLLKAGINSIITMLVYKSISNLVHRRMGLDNLA